MTTAAAVMTTQVEEINGDLFDSKDSLCHCVSECMAMSKGIAVVFKKKFGRVAELKSQGVKVGGCAVLRDDKGGRFVYALVTKPRYFHKPTYGSLTQSLVAMREHAVQNGVTRLSMPLIGCGLDRLQWPRVRQILEEVFNGTGIAITVYRL